MAQAQDQRRELLHEIEILNQTLDKRGLTAGSMERQVQVQPDTQSTWVQTDFKKFTQGTQTDLTALKIVEMETMCAAFLQSGDDEMQWGADALKQFSDAKKSLIESADVFPGIQTVARSDTNNKSFLQGQTNQKVNWGQQNQ